MKNFLFAFLSLFRKAEQPNYVELRAWALEQVRQEQTVVWICEQCKRQSQAYTGAYEPPDRTTDPLKAHKYVEQIRTQHELPKMPRRYHLEIHSEPPPGATLHSTPAFLR
jgi:hypothetical protein